MASVRRRALLPLLIVAACGCAPQAQVAEPVVGAPIGSVAPPQPTTPVTSTAALPFEVSSPAVGADGLLPEAFTCDGAGVAPPIEWTRGPIGTTNYAVVLHHTTGSGDTHWYWVVYDLPAGVTSLEGSGVVPPGPVGTNSIDRKTTYQPPCSQGPGRKEYVVTVYALARPTGLTDPTRVDRPALLAAIEDHVLSTASTTFSVTRTPSAAR